MSSKISVRLMKNDEDNQTYWQVRLHSKRKYGVISTININANDSRVEAQVAFAGGALAEEQNQKYKDLHNPDNCANVAVECFKDAQRRYELGAVTSSTAS